MAYHNSCFIYPSGSGFCSCFNCAYIPEILQHTDWSLTPCSSILTTTGFMIPWYFFVHFYLSWSKSVEISGTACASLQLRAHRSCACSFSTTLSRALSLSRWVILHYRGYWGRLPEQFSCGEPVRWPNPCVRAGRHRLSRPPNDGCLELKRQWMRITLKCISTSSPFASIGTNSAIRDLFSGVSSNKRFK